MLTTHFGFSTDYRNYFIDLEGEQHHFKFAEDAEAFLLEHGLNPSDDSYRTTSDGTGLIIDLTEGD